MKITRIRLRSHLHFKKDLDIQLTYPTGHPKAGAPLEKICLLGQSGTGKTTLLNIIKYFVCENSLWNKTVIDNATFVKDGIEVSYRVDGKHCCKVSMGDCQFEHYEWVDATNKKKIEDVQAFKNAIDYGLKDSAPLLINFPFCVVNPENIKDEEKLASFNKETLNKETGELELVQIANRKVWDFDPASIRAIWNLVFRRVEHFLKEYQNKMRDHFSEIYSNTEDASKIMADFKLWEQSHPNPVKELADRCLNSILKHFNLELETDLKKYKIDLSLPGKMHVIIKRKGTDQEIPYPFLSTGTKQVMLTAIPLFYLEPKNSIIMFDQPETSLYPNIQCLLPETYLNCASNNNQFFFATHSPIVASAFDPWEVVELQFDENGETEQKKYFELDRKVENYKIIPKLLRWDSSYRILFGLDVEGNEERTKRLMDLASLDRQIKKTENKAEKEVLFKEYTDLAQKLDWNIT